MLFAHYLKLVKILANVIFFAQQILTYFTFSLETMIKRYIKTRAVKFAIYRRTLNQIHNYFHIVQPSNCQRKKYDFQINKICFRNKYCRNLILLKICVTNFRR